MADQTRPLEDLAPLKANRRLDMVDSLYDMLPSSLALHLATVWISNACNLDISEIKSWYGLNETSVDRMSSSRYNPCKVVNRDSCT